jgi:hypothetical protein
VSLLPGSYLNVAEMIGFSGNRAEALSSLHAAMTADTYWAPAAAALLLFFHLQITPGLGLAWGPADVDAAAAVLVSPVVAPFLDTSAFMFWMQGLLARARRQPSAALPLLARARELATEMPPLLETVMFDALWAALAAADWPTAAQLAADLSAYSPTAPLYPVVAALAAGAQGDAAAAAAGLAAVPALAAAHPESVRPRSTGQYAVAAARDLLAAHPAPSTADCCERLYELLALWDMVRYIPPATAAAAVTALPAPEESAAVPVSSRARRLFVRGQLLSACTEDPAAGAAAGAALRSVLALPRAPAEGDDIRHLFPFAAYYLLQLAPAEDVATWAPEWRGVRFNMKELFHVKEAFLRHPSLPVPSQFIT